ncbi:Ppx/GppA phosphatase family protein [Oligella urethralis]|uniref:Exopolyphosphatase n=1 Tax=Oligella urethralis TaxID=90245 RepID=A0A2X1UW94_9BURK|nr:Ppx/GppA phosphatase family protein [Oligella urethralis]SPY07983.1 Exopolyphosphatase [Oligella urethralis]
MENNNLLAAVDLGSNSFRLTVGRIEERNGESYIFAIDRLKETVRLAAGLDEDKVLSDEAIERAVGVLQRFAERIQNFHPHQVRAVATNTFRVAKNRNVLLQRAEAALGFPIEVVSGPEEARLVFSGVAHELPLSDKNRLVIDIGGGSTEFIIGKGFQSLLVKSLPIGCVSFTKLYFPGGMVSAKAFKQAEINARNQIQVLSKSYRNMGWAEAFGSSGSAKALVAVLQASGFSERGITMEGMEKLKRILIKTGSANSPLLLDLKTDRIEVLPAGLAIMMAAFKELKIKQMNQGDGALRVGVLYDMLGRKSAADIRAGTVAQYMHRYRVDTKQALRVRQLASAFYESALTLSKEAQESWPHDMHLLLKWACDLHEIGLSIAQSSYHRHSAYVLQHADMPGFSKDEQTIMARLNLESQGKLNKSDIKSLADEEWQAILCIRLALIFLRKRQAIHMENLVLKIEAKDITLTIGKRWLENHPLTEFSLTNEKALWEACGFNFQIKPISQNQHGVASDDPSSHYPQSPENPPH